MYRTTAQLLLVRASRWLLLGLARVGASALRFHRPR